MAGSIVLATADLGGGITKYSIAWTSDASGNVNGTPIALKRGRLLQVKFVPTNGHNQPSNNYAATLLDGDGVDFLAGTGATLSNTASSIAVSVVSSVSPAFVEPGNFTPTISAAGNVTNGRIDLIVGPA
jgi:hypothetical protein